MGGINHQPCRAYLPNSTAMSRALTLASAHFMLANVALEDVILGELDAGKPHEPEAILEHLGRSRSELSNMMATIASLRAQMEDTPFADLDTLKTTNLALLGKQFHLHGLHVPTTDWAIAATIMDHQGFFGMLKIFEERIDELDDLTALLSSKVGAWIEGTEPGLRHVALEENHKTNFKVTFAQLFTAWASFQQLFLASSLISTELWYRQTDVGSLVNDPALASIAA